MSRSVLLSCIHLSSTDRLEVAAALRIRLNETTDSLDQLQRDSSALEVRATTAESALTRAQSDRADSPAATKRPLC